MNLGIDVGNGYTKFNEGKFASKVKVGEIINFGKVKKEIHQVEFEGIKFIVGEGAAFTGDNRYFEKYYKLCLLTAIALSSKEDFIEANLVIGLPEKKFKLLGDKLQKHIESFGQQQIKVKDTLYNIRINDCLVFIEGAYPIKTEEEYNVLVIDNGAGTINVTQWEELAITTSASYNEGMNKMYADITSYLNTNKEGADFKPSEIEKIINKKSVIIDNKETDITDIRPIVENHIVETASYIKNDFKVKNASKIYLIGGGGADTITYWQKQFPVIQLVENSQMINQKIYDLVADSEFNEQ